MIATLALTMALAGQPHLTRPPLQGPIARHLEQTTFEQTPLAARTRFAQAGSRDSLKNGAAIGAVIGGAATGVFIGFLCHAFNDSDMSCWPPTLLYAAAGAGAGALAGAGVDALFQRRFAVRVPIKF